MRLLYILALSSLLSAPVFAADLGTYRPGAPYHSVIAQGADVCENQCAGDAQCRGWNYVKVNPRAPGVCEFNSKPANPIESAISISGQGAALLAPNISTGPTNTVRVGTRSKPTQSPIVRRSSSTRRVVRQAVPQQIRPEKTVARRPVHQGRALQNGSLTAQQNRHRQTTGHVIPPAHAPRYIQQHAIQPQSPGGQRRLIRDPRIAYQRPAHGQQLRHNLDGSQQPITPYQNPRGIPSQRAIQQQGRPQIGVPIAGAAPQGRQSQASLPPVLPQGSVNDPVTYQNAPSRIRQAEVAAAQRAAYQQNLSVEQAQQSLFGSLNDDVKTPRPLVSLPVNPDAPIATAQSRPTVAVSQELLGTLAGG